MINLFSVVKEIKNQRGKSKSIAFLYYICDRKPYFTVLSCTQCTKKGKPDLGWFFLLWIFPSSIFISLCVLDFYKYTSTWITWNNTVIPNLESISFEKLYVFNSNLCTINSSTSNSINFLTHTYTGFVWEFWVFLFLAFSVVFCMSACILGGTWWHMVFSVILPVSISSALLLSLEALQALWKHHKRL